PAGSLGTIGAFSFYATKNITTGEGGMLTTNDETVAARARRFRHHGQGTQYLYETMGYNYRMTDLQAALGIEQLKHLADWTRRRQAHAAFLTSALAGIPGLKLPVILGDSQHAFHQYTIRVTKACACTRDELRRHLEQRGVESAIFYPKPLHLHPHFASLGYREGAFPEAERAAAEVLSLPVHPGLTHKQLERIATAVREATTC
ncbi:aminotransferase DegT, partial [Candidatus Woesearchaeota archaeon]